MAEAVVLTRDMEGMPPTERTAPRMEKQNPLERIAGSYADDPFWSEFVQALEDSRRAMDDVTIPSE